MAIYKITIDTDASPDREAGLQKVTADYNAHLQPAEPPVTDPPTPPEPVVPLTVEQYLQHQLDIAVDSYAKSFIDAETNVIAVKFATADETLRAAVKQTLDIP